MTLREHDTAHPDSSTGQREKKRKGKFRREKTEMKRHYFCGSLWLDDSTLQFSQQTPWAHSAPAFRVQLLALQQGLVHSYTTPVSRAVSLGQNIKGEYALQQRRDTTQHLFFPTVAFLSFLQVTVAAALPSIHGSGVWHVEETLSSSRAQVALQLLQVTVVKHTRKWVPGLRWGKARTQLVRSV